MNSKEALEDLREVKGWNDDEFNKRLDIIEKDLQRNEPMKVGIQVYTNGFFKNWRCENCHNSIEEKYANYCSDCGQKLDWEIGE